MTVVQVAVPVLRGRTVFMVDRGRHWSIVEHLLLEALVKKGWRATDLALAASIPRRVVVEAMIRLMRAGWVELAFEQSSTIFKATARGVAVAPNSELPKVPELRKRPTNYIIDLLSGEMFRNKDFSTHTEEEVRQRAAKDNLIFIEPSSWHTLTDPNEALRILLDPEETFVSAEPGGILRRWVVVTMKDGVIVSGLPEKRPLSNLRSKILEAVAQLSVGHSGSQRTVHEVKETASEVKVAEPVCRQVRFSSKDLILDGPAHRNILLKTLKEARSIVFIHSTFISQKHVQELLPHFEEAIERGVKINIFWGQNEELDATNSTQVAIASLRRLPLVRRMNEGLIFHSYSTGSHAKLLVADTQKVGEYVAVVGSCNWLTSNFSSYEASVAIHDPRVVGDVLRYLALISCTHDGAWSDLATEVVQICKDLERQPIDAQPNAKMTVVTGGFHNRFVLRARDEAQIRVFVASHRLGAAAKPGIVAPLISAASKKGIASEVYYCRLTSPVKAASGARLVSDAGAAGVEISPVESPRVHAKVLAWDNDYLLVSSLNWLSADQVQLSGLKELGVFVDAPGVASNFVNNFHTTIGK